MKLDVGDTIVFIGQGYHGASAIDKFNIQGIIHLPSPKLNSSVVYMNLKDGQEFLSAYNMISSLVINLNDNDYM